jgi:AmmeMemoRadiSam system protein B
MRASAIFGYLLLCVSLTTFSQVVREPHLAGISYPDNADSLCFLISGYLKNHKLVSETNDVKVLIVPHYPPAWDLTAYGFKQIEGCRPHTVVLISNYHYDTLMSKPFDGIAIDSADFWRTPFSTIPVNRKLADKLVRSNEKIIFRSSIFGNDWTLEPLLPFLQTVLNKSFEILPILFGNDLRIGGEINDNYRILGEKLKRHLRPADLTYIMNEMLQENK